jgi:hypothetical protein
MLINQSSWCRSIVHNAVRRSFHVSSRCSTHGAHGPSIATHRQMWFARSADRSLADCRLDGDGAQGRNDERRESHREWDPTNGGRKQSECA